MEASEYERRNGEERMREGLWRCIQGPGTSSVWSVSGGEACVGKARLLALIRGSPGERGDRGKGQGPQEPRQLWGPSLWKWQHRRGLGRNLPGGVCRRDRGRLGEQRRQGQHSNEEKHRRRRRRQRLKGECEQRVKQ